MIHHLFIHHRLVCRLDADASRAMYEPKGMVDMDGGMGSLHEDIGELRELEVRPFRGL